MIPTAPGIVVADFTRSQLAIAVADQVIGAATLGVGVSYNTASRVLDFPGTASGTVTGISGSAFIAATGSGVIGLEFSPTASIVVRAINATGSITSPAITTTNQTVSGTISAGTSSGFFTGTGSALTLLNASNLASGTSSRPINTTLGTISALSGTTATISTVSGTLGAFTTVTGAGSGITSLTAANITGTVTNAVNSANVTASALTATTATLATASGTLAAFTTLTGAGAGITTINAGNISSGTMSQPINAASGTISALTVTTATGGTFSGMHTGTGSAMTLTSPTISGTAVGGAINTGSITSSTLTSGGVVFSGVNGLLTVASTLTYATNTLTHTGANNAGVLTTTIAVGTSGSATNRVQNSGGRSMEIGCYGSAVGAYGAVTGNTPYIYSSGSSGSMVIAAEGSGGIILAAGTTVPQVGSISTASVLLMGVPTVRKGSVAMAGNTSGAVTLSVNAIAGSHSIILPAATGNNGTVPVTDGTGVWTMGRAGLFASASLTYSAILPGMSQDLFITVTGAATNDPVTPAKPATIESGIFVEMFVSTSNVICSRAHNVAAIGTITPAVQTFGALVAKA